MERPKIVDQITFLYTNDLDSTSKFYEHVIGLDLILDQGSCRIYHTCTNSYLGFCKKHNREGSHSDIIFTLVTPDVDEWYGYLSSQGICIEKPPERNPRYNIYHFFIRDPNGYVIEIQRFNDPLWNTG